MKDTSGVIATTYNVVVRLEEVAEKTIGGVILPEQHRDREQRAMQKGVIVAVSPAAFTYHEWHDSDRLPQVGDRVMFQRYSGLYFESEVDGSAHMIVLDKDIQAIIDPNAGAAEAAA